MFKQTYSVLKEKKLLGNLSSKQGYIFGQLFA